MKFKIEKLDTLYVLVFSFLLNEFKDTAHVYFTSHKGQYLDISLTIV
jgi:hypothetical protein